MKRLENLIYTQVRAYLIFQRVSWQNHHYTFLLEIDVSPVSYNLVYQKI